MAGGQAGEREGGQAAADRKGNQAGNEDTNTPEQRAQGCPTHMEHLTAAPSLVVQNWGSETGKKAEACSSSVSASLADVPAVLLGATTVVLRCISVTCRGAGEAQGGLAKGQASITVMIISIHSSTVAGCVGDK